MSQKVFKLRSEVVGALAVKLQDVLVPEERRKTRTPLFSTDCIEQFAALHMLLAAVREVLLKMEVAPEELEKVVDWAGAAGKAAMPDNPVVRVPQRKVPLN